MEFLLLSLLFDPLVLPQEFLTVIFILVFGFGVHARFFDFFGLAIIAHEGLGVCIFRERVITEIDKAFCFLG